MDISKITNGLEMGKDEIWHSTNQVEIAYPEEGNQHCFQIEDQSYWFMHRNACILNALSPYPKITTVFDIGGGNGFQSLAMQNHGIEAVIVEPGITGARNSKSRGIKHVICSTLEESEFKPASIPAASLFDVLEHIEHDAIFLSNLRDKLIEKGKLIITVPAYMALWSSTDVFAGHFRRYTLNSLEKDLHAHGFRVIYKTHIFSFFIIPHFLMRALPSRLGLGKSKSRRQDLQKQSPILNKLLEIELAWLRKGKRLPFGTSCLVIAEAVKDN